MDLLGRLQSALGDRYAIERELGAGGMATVYLAEDLKHHRQVAIKVLKPELAATLGAERFHREVQIAAQLQHPNILPLLDSGEAAGFLYYAMPYVEGQSLRERLAREGALPVGDAVRILRDVVDALTEAHAHGVVHRDIKPENIMLRGRHALVTDFGVAKAISEATGRQTLTTAGVALGTPAYMAPEQASADPHLDHRVDIYAVGAVGYELLTGRPVFMGTTPQMVLSAHVTEAPVPITRHRETVPRALEALVMRCLEKRPADRWQSAEELLPQLEALVTPSGGITPTDTRPFGALRPRRGLRIALAAAATVVLAVAAVFVWRSRARLALNANLLAITPFDIVGADPALTVWREGLPDIIWRLVDGSGPLQTVSQNVVLRRWAGRGDEAAAVSLGRATGAGLVLTGSLVPVASDSVQVTFALVDVARGNTLHEAELRESRGRMEQLADTIALRVLGVLSGERGLGPPRLQSLGTRSPAALRAFLKGEQFYRRSGYDSAITHYTEAVRRDSTFALAWWRLGAANGWSSRPDEAARASARADSLNRGLPPRESLLIAISVAWEKANYFSGDSASRNALTRLFVMTDAAVRRYPEDPEAWYWHGDALFHFGFATGRWPDSARVSFDRAIRLDSTIGDALLHGAQMAFYLEGPEGIVRYVRAGIGAGLTGESEQAYPLLLAMVESVLSGTPLEQRLHGISLEALRDLWWATARWPDSSEVSITVAREMANRNPAWSSYLARALAFRGHLAEAAPIARSRSVVVFAQLALLGGVSEGSLVSAVDGWLAGSEAPYQALPVLAARGDATRVTRTTEALVAYSRRTWRESAGQVDLFRAIGAAYVALAERDTARALRGLAQLPFSWACTWCYQEELVRA